MDIISFILNDCEFKFPCTRKILNKIPDKKEYLYSQLFNKHKYTVNSNVRNEIYQSYLDNWQNDTTPTVNSDNILEYYQLNQEFGIFDESFSTPQKEPLLYVNLLKSNNNTLPLDKSNIEKSISLHLDTYGKCQI